MIADQGYLLPLSVLSVVNSSAQTAIANWMIPDNGDRQRTL
ncbi:MAG: hypothetical protein ACO36E_10790 [Synechocystis sp.]